MNNLFGCCDCGNTYFKVKDREARIICTGCGQEHKFNTQKKMWVIAE